jgi:asparagine synthase (glutamine-hydrolysing)
MCGITGLWMPSLLLRQADLENRALQMARRLAHRGPDGSGSWCDPQAGVAFGHRRLAILDLSAAGHQPMVSADGRWVLTYNGEMYNHKSVRAHLDRGGIRFRGHSDSEVFVELVAASGVESALQSFDGMFAVALWDRHEQELWLARDAFGEKPLCYAETNSGLIFASELSALRAYPDYDFQIDETALNLYLRYGHVPAPYTIDRSARKLEPGAYVRVDARKGAVQVGSVQRYFSAELEARRELETPLGEEEGMEAFADAFATSVQGRLESDVPLGAFLSGGIDSTAVVAQMCASSSAPVRTFTVAFGELGYDESPAAARVAEHLGTEHTVYRLGESEALTHAPTIAHAYDEPFADSSQLPTRMICGVARADVTVALTGDGGDELFGGYNRHVAIPKLNALVAAWPPVARKTVGSALQALSNPRFSALWSGLSRLAPAARRTPQLREKFGKVAALLEEDGLVNRYRRACMLNANPELLVGPAASSADRLPSMHGLEDSHWMMIADTLTYLPDDILVKVDRASMNVSLETRSPFLSRDVFRAAWRLPSSLRIHNGQGKRALRALALRSVPESMLDRPKAGFAVPLSAWLRGPLKEWARSLLEPRRIRDDGWFDGEAVERMWSEHQQGRVDHAHRLWSVLMFQSWMDADTK